MKNRFKICFVAMMIITCQVVNPIHAEAAEASDPIYSEFMCTQWLIHRDGKYIFQSYDVLKSSTTYYRTVAFQISRIRRGCSPEAEPFMSDTGTMTNNDCHYYYLSPDGDHSDPEMSYSYYTRNGMKREEVLIEFDSYDEHYVYEESGHQLNTYIFDESIIDAAIDQYPDWRTEVDEMVNAGETVYVGLDSVLQLVVNNVPQGGIIWTPDGPLY